MIQVGSRKQLFLEDDLIENMTHVKQVLDPESKAPHNPVIRQDRPWAGNALPYGCVFYDEDQQQFRLWYQSSRLHVDLDGKTQHTEQEDGLSPLQRRVSSGETALGVGGVRGRGGSRSVRVVQEHVGQNQGDRLRWLGLQ